jgi:uncharacterized protein
MMFIDTSAFVARYLAHDQYHEAARNFWAELTDSETPLVTSSHIISEALTLLGRRSSYRYAAERARSLFASTHVQILRASEGSEIDAVFWFERMAGHRVSFTDCISFALMQRLGIRQAFTFDEHFVHAGFEIYPGRG